jgi:hypothetical protein
MPDKYSDKLKDPRWQKKRLEIMQRDEFRCQSCYDDKTTLHIHHRRYILGRAPWDYPDALLVTLCESCHEAEREMLESYCDDLVTMVKEKFFAEDIYTLTTGIHQLEIVCHDSHVIADVYSWALSDPDTQKELAEKYFQHLKETSNKDK